MFCVSAKASSCFYVVYVSGCEEECWLWSSVGEVLAAMSSCVVKCSSGATNEYNRWQVGTDSRFYVYVSVSGSTSDAFESAPGLPVYSGEYMASIEILIMLTGWTYKGVSDGTSDRTNYVPAGRGIGCRICN